VAVEAPPIWPAFGDLMSCLFGLFVLFFVWAVAIQVSLTKTLETERATHDAQVARLAALESALAGPLAEGRITLVDGRIGIRGSVLFDLSSAELKDEGRALLRDLSAALRTYLAQRDELLMVSGFTDDVPFYHVTGSYKDNWELSAQRALTVTRALEQDGLPRDWIFAAGFGDSHPIVPNSSPENRAKNRRVEIAPVPRTGNGTLAPRGG
jgi:flagellar motor protein MotB